MKQLKQSFAQNVSEAWSHEEHAKLFWPWKIIY